MDSKEVVIDTNFFMVPFQFNVDVITELENLLPSYKLTTPSFVINELKGLKKNSKGKVEQGAQQACNAKVGLTPFFLILSISIVLN